VHIQINPATAVTICGVLFLPKRLDIGSIDSAIDSRLVSRYPIQNPLRCEIPSTFRQVPQK